MLETERTKLCGEWYKHDASCRASRAGSTRGELALGGRRVAVRRPRVTDGDGHEIPLDTWADLASADPLGARALEQMAIGVATRKYDRSLETLPDSIETRGASKSAVSRRFVALTTEKLAEWMEHPLGDLDIWTVFIDGIHFREHVILCALGIDATGAKHVLGLWEGATENEVACKSMLENPRREASSRIAHVCSSSTAARDYAPRSAACSGRGRSCSAARCTRFATSSVICPTRGTRTSARRCVKHTSVRRSTRRSAS